MLAYVLREGRSIFTATDWYLALASGATKCFATVVKFRVTLAFVHRLAFADLSAAKSLIYCSLGGCGGRKRP